MEKPHKIVTVDVIYKLIKELGEDVVTTQFLENYFKSERFKQYKEWVSKNHPNDNYLRRPLMHDYLLSGIDKSVIVWINTTSLASVRGFTVDTFSLTELDEPNTHNDFMLKLILFSFI